MTYYRRQSILSSLTENLSKAKDSDVALDNASNTFLFVDKFEKKFLKDTNAMEKLEVSFNGFQHKSSKITSGASCKPFMGALYPNSVVAEDISSEHSQKN